MFHRFAPHSVFMLLALCVSFMSLGVQSMPAGSVMCMEAGGHLALESSAQVCCLSMIDADGDGLPDPVPLDSGVVTCRHCIDIYLPHDRFDTPQGPAIVLPEISSQQVVIAIIDWTVCRAAIPLRSHDAAYRRPSHLVQIATTVIRC